jgi:hypothetical protein
MRHSKSNALNQEAQDYLAPLQHRDSIRELTIDSPVAGAYYSHIASPIYQAVKVLGKTGEFNPVAAFARDLVRSYGDGSTLTSNPSVDAIFQAIKGFQEGLGER